MTAAMVKTFGAEELIDKFNRLAPAVRDRIGKKVLQAGINVYVRAAQDAVPTAKTPGHSTAGIRKAIRGRLLEINGQLAAKIGLNVGGQTEPVAHLFVLGTVDRYTGAKTRKVRGRLVSRPTKNKPAYRGRMPSNDFFSRAIESAESLANDAMRQVFEQQITAEFGE